MQHDLPEWSNDLDSPEWSAVFADPRWVDLMRRMAADVADDLTLDVDDEAAA